MKAAISTKTHAILDYVGGILTTCSPWIFGFVHLGGGAVLIPVTLGTLQLVMAIFSNHQLGLFKSFPMQLHLTLDMVAGFIIMVSPLLYGFYHLVFWPHVLLGMMSFFAGMLTQHSPLYKLEQFDERGI